MPPPSGIPAPQTLPSGSPGLSAEARALHLANQLVQVRHDLASVQADLRNARSERDSLRAELARTRARMEELEAAATGTPVEPPAPPTQIDPDLELKLRGRINELEAALAKARSSTPAPAPIAPEPAAAAPGAPESATPEPAARAVAAPAPDDLKLVKGIGPKIAKLLRTHGVTTVQQIADFTDADIELIARKIGIKAARIRKDDWVGHAKRLLAAR